MKISKERLKEIIIQELKTEMNEDWRERYRGRIQDLKAKMKDKTITPKEKDELSELMSRYELSEEFHEDGLVKELSPPRESDLEADKKLITHLYEIALARSGEKGLEGEAARQEAARFLAMAQNKTWKHPASDEVDVEDVMYRGQE